MSLFFKKLGVALINAVCNLESRKGYVVRSTKVFNCKPKLSYYNQESGEFVDSKENATLVPLNFAYRIIRKRLKEATKISGLVPRNQYTFEPHQPLSESAIMPLASTQIDLSVGIPNGRQ